MNFIRILPFISSPGPRYLLRIAILVRLFRQLLHAKISHSDQFHIVEIGPGNGDVTAYLASMYPSCSITVIESSSDSLNALQQRFSDQQNIRIIAEDVFDLYESIQRIDLVLCFEVLEHLHEDIDLMRTINEMLINGGYLLLSVPAYMKKWQVQDEAAGHVRRYEEVELRTKLTTAGFNVLLCNDYGFPLTTIMRPFRYLFYRKKTDQTLAEKTAISGVKNRLLPKSMTRVVAICLLPFIFLQTFFANFRIGDGFIVAAEKRTK